MEQRGGNLFCLCQSDGSRHRFGERSERVVKKLNVFVDRATPVSFGDICRNGLGSICQLRSEPKIDFRFYESNLPNELKQLDGLLPNNQFHVTAVLVPQLCLVIIHYSITPFSDFIRMREFDEHVFERGAALR